MAAVSVFLKSGDGIIIGGEPGPLLNFYQGLLCGETPFVELVEPNGTARMAVRRDDVASVLYDAAADGNAVVFSQVVRLHSRPPEMNSISDSCAHGNPLPCNHMIAASIALRRKLHNSGGCAR